MCIWGFVPLLVLAMSAPCIDPAPVRRRRESVAGGVTPSQRQNYSRNPRLRGKGWKIYSSIDSATHSFLNSGLQSHFAIQKIHFSPLAQLWEEWESAVDVSREMFLFNPVSAHLSCLYWQKGNLMKWQSWDEMGFICLHPPSSLPSPQTSLFILHDERCPH